MSNRSHQLSSKTFITISLFVYVGLLIYGTLFPLSEFQAITKNWNQLINDALSSKISRSDLITNSLIYIPLGFLIFQRFAKNPGLAIAIAFLIATSLSATLEFLQLYLPSRITAISDLTLNSAGGLLGGMIGFLTSSKSYSGNQFVLLKNKLFEKNSQTNLGLFVLFFWGMSQLMPLVPSLDWGFIKNSLKPIILVLNQKLDLNHYRLLFYIFSLTSIGLILSISLRKHKSVAVVFGSLVFAVLTAKIFVMDRQLSVEALAGFFVSLILIIILDNGSKKMKCVSGVFFTILFILASELEPIQHSGYHTFTWIPFAAQMQNVMGFIDMILGIWPYMCLAFFASSLSSVKNPQIALAGGIAILGLAIGLEYAQTAIPGRYPDISDIIMAVGGWVLYFLYYQHLQKRDFSH